MFENNLFIWDDRTKKISPFKRFIQRCLSPIVDLIYKFLLTKNRSGFFKKKYYLSVCAIFKNEAVIFNEWIEYHKLLGVEHFYLYNNFSTDDFYEVLKPHIDNDVVTLIDWPLKSGQMDAYRNCYESFGNDTQWLAFIDLDEFICPYEELKISDWLRNYINFSGVAIYWRMFGTSGRISHDPSLLHIEQYTLCWPKHYIETKVIVNTDFVISDYSTMHMFTTNVRFLGFNFSIPAVNEFKKFLKWDFHRTGFNRNFSIQINHYWSRAYSEFVDKKIGKGAACKNYEHTMEQFWWHESKNGTSDARIFRYVLQLKLSLQENLLALRKSGR